MEKETYIKRVLFLKKTLPKCLVPMIQAKHPEYMEPKKEGQLRRALSLRSVDTVVLSHLEELDDFFNSNKDVIL